MIAEHLYDKCSTLITSSMMEPWSLRYYMEPRVVTYVRSVMC